MVSVKIRKDKCIDYMTFKTRYEAFNYLVKHGYSSTDKKLNTYLNRDTGACAKIIVE